MKTILYDTKFLGFFSPISPYTPRLFTPKLRLSFLCKTPVFCEMSKTPLFSDPNLIHRGVLCSIPSSPIRLACSHPNLQAGGGEGNTPSRSDRPKVQIL